MASNQAQREPVIRANRQIRATEVRLIDSAGEQVGVLPLEEALSAAQDQGLDLVEVSPQASPPVCRVMDYGQYKYQLSKKQHEARKHQRITHFKEIKLRPKTEEHDFQFKLRHAVDFVKAGDKVKISLILRGREMAHPEQGRRLLERFVAGIEGSAMVEVPIKQEGRTLTLVLAPHRDHLRSAAEVQAPSPAVPAAAQSPVTEALEKKEAQQAPPAAVEVAPHSSS